MVDGIIIGFAVLDLEAEDTRFLGHYELPAIPEREDHIRIEDTNYVVLGKKWDVSVAFKRTAYAVEILLQASKAVE
jgi:hypothetical protein